MNPIKFCRAWIFASQAALPSAAGPEEGSWLEADRDGSATCVLGPLGGFFGAWYDDSIVDIMATFGRSTSSQGL